MRITLENWSSDILVHYASNPRKNDHAVEKMAAAIKEFGFRIPVVAKRDGTIVDGHLRKKAADKLGMTEVPVIPADDLTEAQIKAFRLSANKSAEWAEWDNDLLALELGGLNDEGFDLGVIGFGEDEIDRLLALNDRSEGLTDEDDTPEAQEHAVTETGDVWLLGKHRVRCGDSTSADDVAALLNGVEPHLMVTDPPYGVNYSAGWRDHALGGKEGGRATGEVGNDDNADWSEAWSLFPGDVAYVWHAGNKAHIVAKSLESCGFDLRAQVVWAKSQFVVGRGHFHPQHEPCWYAVKKQGHWQGSRKESTLWQIDKPQKSETGHSTQKPVECMRRPIVNNSAPGQPVYDPFLGSGTTLIAGEKEGRPVYGMELSPNYVDVIVRRWQEFTGKEATLEADGRTFADVEAHKAPEAEDGAA